MRATIIPHDEITLSLSAEQIALIVKEEETHIDTKKDNKLCSYFEYLTQKYCNGRYSYEIFEASTCLSKELYYKLINYEKNIYTAPEHIVLISTSLNISFTEAVALFHFFGYYAGADNQKYRALIECLYLLKDARFRTNNDIDRATIADKLYFSKTNYHLSRKFKS